MSGRELIGGKYYLIDEEKCLYRSTEAVSYTHLRAHET